MRLCHVPKRVADRAPLERTGGGKIVEPQRFVLKYEKLVLRRGKRQCAPCLY
jgi:hypothetical protein